MRTSRSGSSPLDLAPDAVRDLLTRWSREAIGLALLALAGAAGVALATWSVNDPSFTHATSRPVSNLLGFPGSAAADLLMQTFGLGALAIVLVLLVLGAKLVARRPLERIGGRLLAGLIGVLAAAGCAAALPQTGSWPLRPIGLGGFVGDAVLGAPAFALGGLDALTRSLAALGFGLLAVVALSWALRRGAAEPPAQEPAEEPAHPRRARPSPVEDDVDEAGEPSTVILLLGMLWRALAIGLSRLRRGVRALAASLFAAEARETARAPRREPALAGGPRMEPAATPPQRRETPGAPPPGEDPFEDPFAPAAPGPARTPAAAPFAQTFTEAGRPAPAAAPPIGLAWLFKRAEARTGGPARRIEPALDAAPPAASSPGAASAPSPVHDREAPDADRFDDAPDEDGLDYAPEDRLSDYAPVEAAAETQRPAGAARVLAPAAPIRMGRRQSSEAQPSMFGSEAGYAFPPLMLLAEPKKTGAVSISADALEQNARLLEGVLQDFSVRGEIINVRPGPVVTLYELEPAPGTKSSRVIGLAEDIARSMSAVAARVAVVPGRNAIGVELPNARRETVYLRELLASQDFESSKFRLPICLGKTIGGESVIVELAKMPHLLIAGTTGSGKSVAVNTMILSLLYRLKPDECKLIMIDPKMLELSVYDGIPHLLTPVVTDPKKAVSALKWAVREMEERYRLMSKVGVRNIDGYNARAAEAAESGETFTRQVQTGFDRETGAPIYESEEIALAKLPYIVVIIDEMADLMMVAGKDIEGAVQRLAQMARAAGIHVIMATQRPSVDVITGTIKANFPTRISFQVTSRIDSRTILGEQGAEQLLGQGDMLYMAGGGRISRVHGPFVSDNEVEKVVAHLKSQGRPNYLDAITADEDAGEADDDGAVFDKGAFGEEGGDLYDQAIRIVMRDKKCSTSYIQRRLGVGYNKAASLVERMEREGLVGPSTATGKREILMAGAPNDGPDEDG
jgi:S-DNA-T family DNA segregation ATPase FtsK/SpoIIIE